MVPNLVFMWIVGANKNPFFFVVIFISTTTTPISGLKSSLIFLRGYGHDKIEVIHHHSHSCLTSGVLEIHPLRIGL